MTRKQRNQPEDENKKNIEITPSSVLPTFERTRKRTRKSTLKKKHHGKVHF